MITRLPKHISGDWECKFDRIKCSSNQPWYNKTCWCECKDPIKRIWKEDYIWNPSMCACEINKY